ncbi:MAG: chain-length determining protein [Prevotella sp.]|nr:chain-length determining protein [Prevotella sp.]
MSESNNIKQADVIDLRILFKKIGENKKLFFIILPIVFVLSCLLIICVPRYYITDVRLVPEVDNSSNSGGMGSLGAIASSFGVDIASMQNGDAISPLLYPDLMADNGFVAKIFPIKVTSSGLKDEPVYTTTYYDYLKSHQKSAWWSKAMNWVKNKLKTDDEETVGGKSSTFDPYKLSKGDNDIAEATRGNIGIGIDKKTGVISISVKAQDPLICKTMADSLKEMLQKYIIEYRTSKSKTDLAHFQKLEAEAKVEYEAARLKYSKFADAYTDINVPSYIVERDDLENDMQLKYNAYTTLQSQVQLAHAKVQAQTPAFTLLKGADVPVKPTGPKRMIFVLAMTFLATCFIIGYIFNKEFINTKN